MTLMSEEQLIRKRAIPDEKTLANYAEWINDLSGISLEKARDKVLAKANHSAKFWNEGNVLKYLGAIELPEEEIPEYAKFNEYTRILLEQGAVGDAEELETVLQVIRLFEDNAGIKINPLQAYLIWDYVSDEMSASWLCKHDDTECWRMIINKFLFKDWEKQIE